jgi:hypothetical protein
MRRVKEPALMADEDGKVESRGLPIAIGPVKLNLQVQNIEGLRAAWEKYCVPLSRTFWPLIKGEIDIALQKQPLRRLRNIAEIEEMARSIATARGGTVEEVSPSIADPLIEAAPDEEREELKELWAKLLAAAMDPVRQKRVRLSFVATLKPSKWTRWTLRFWMLFTLLIRQDLARTGTEGTLFLKVLVSLRTRF